MPRAKAMTWKEHRAKWIDCSLCSLCKRRRKVVLARGKVPCDVLFIGEAPGASEDSLGSPFVGPAGHLLDQMIEDALDMTSPDQADLPAIDSGPRIAFTNLIACIPKDEDGNKISSGDDIPLESIEACSERLN
ncbi:MAG: uracil-DNA glycosylase family protein, partial [Nitrosopumilus sp.]